MGTTLGPHAMRDIERPAHPRTSRIASGLRESSATWENVLPLLPGAGSIDALLMIIVMGRCRRTHGDTRRIWVQSVRPAARSPRPPSAAGQRKRWRTELSGRCRRSSCAAPSNAVLGRRHNTTSDLTVSKAVDVHHQQSSAYEVSDKSGRTPLTRQCDDRQHEERAADRAHQRQRSLMPGMRLGQDVSACEVHQKAGEKP